MGTGMNKGLTLVEVLVSTFLSGLILLATYSAFFSIKKSVEGVDEERELMESGRVLIELLRKDIRGIKKAGNTAFICKREEIDEISYSKIDFITTSSLKTGFHAQAEVGYSLAKDEHGKLILVRRESLVQGDPTEGGTYFEVSTMIARFNISMYDGNFWFDEWDSKARGSIPVALRIELKLRGKGDVEASFILEEEIPS